MREYRYQYCAIGRALWRAKHDHRAREVAVEQREQALLIPAACARGAHSAG
jgi:hypothetical protein